MKKLICLFLLVLIPSVCFGDGITITPGNFAKKGANSDITSITGLTTPLTVAQGGQGSATLADGGILVGASTGPVEVVSPGATTELLVGGGAGTNPVWTTATGSGAPVRATSPTITTLSTAGDMTGDRSYLIGYQNFQNPQGPGYKLNGTNAFVNLDSAAAGLVATTTTKGYIRLKAAFHDLATDNNKVWYWGDTNANERFGMYVPVTDNKLAFICIVAGTTQWQFEIDDTLTEGVIYDVLLVQNGTVPVLYINGNLSNITYGTTTDQTAWFASLTGVDNGRLGCGNYNSGGNNDFVNVTSYQFNVGNVALDNSDIVDKALINSSIAAYKYAGVPGDAPLDSFTSGTIVVGREYVIGAFVAGDDFTNVGAASNATGVVFTATGTTPTTWTNSSTLVRVGEALTLNSDGITLASWLDNSGNAFDSTATAVKISSVKGIASDQNETSGNTRFLLYDVDNAKYERVSVGAPDSGGGGYKVLRIPN